MKKCLVLLALLGIIGFAALGEEGFAVDGLVLGQPEMEEVIGGRHPDIDGSYRGYGPYDRVVERDMTTRVTKSQIKESAKAAVDCVLDMPKGIVETIKEAGKELIRKVAYSWIDRW